MSPNYFTCAWKIILFLTVYSCISDGNPVEQSPKRNESVSNLEQEATALARRGESKKIPSIPLLVGISVGLVVVLKSRDTIGFYCRRFATTVSKCFVGERKVVTAEREEDGKRENEPDDEEARRTIKRFATAVSKCFVGERKVVTAEREEDGKRENEPADEEARRSIKRFATAVYINKCFVGERKVETAARQEDRKKDDEKTDEREKETKETLNFLRILKLNSDKVI